MILKMNIISPYWFSFSQRLLEVRDGLHFVVTATSRPQRPGEVDGKDYYFVSKDEFLLMIERDELLEHAIVYGDYKGIPKKQVGTCFEVLSALCLELYAKLFFTLHFNNHFLDKKIYFPGLD